MSVRLRLRRLGRKKKPFYRIVAADQRSPRDGRFIEVLGYYNPLEVPHKIELKEDRVLYWLDKGAQPSDTVRSLLRQKGIWLKLDLRKRGVEQDKIEEEFKKWELLQIERRKRVESAGIQAKKKKKEEAEEEAADVKKESEVIVAHEEETKEVGETADTEPKEETVVEKTVQAEPIDDTAAEVEIKSSPEEISTETEKKEIDDKESESVVDQEEKTDR